MISANHAGQNPEIDQNAYIHPTAVVMGNVRIATGCFVGPNTVIRSDEPGPDGKIAPIIIKSGANIQDGVIIHALGGSRFWIGKGLPWRMGL